MKSDQFTSSISTSLPAEIPDDIQWMPPGAHEITTLGEGGKPEDRTVNVHAGLVVILQTGLVDLQAKATAGVGDKPYLDFNHEDGAASGHITQFYWGGDDPAKGGIRAKVDWTDGGRAALKGRAYRRFSPSFFVNREGELSGAPLNMGGLVNRAAFRKIQPIWSRDGGQVTNPKDIQMDPKDKELADLRAANQELSGKLAAQENDQTVKAKDSEIISLKATIKANEDQAKERVKVEAKSAVAQAVKEGKIASQDTTMHNHYEALYTAAPEATKAVLASLPVNPALQTIVAAGAGTPAAPATPGEHEFVVKAKGIAEKEKISLSRAFTKLAGEQPKLYEAYNQAFVGK